MAPGIATLLRMMPDGYEEACFSTGAIVRKRDIKSPDDLMMLCLFHLHPVSCIDMATAK